MDNYCRDNNCLETGKICIPSNGNPRVVVIGGGFAGLSLIRHLKNKPVQVILFDKNNHHSFLPLLYQVATCGTPPDSIVFPFRKIFRNYKNVIFRMARVTKIDTKDNSVITNIGKVKYDYLVIAGGSVNNFFGNHNFSKYSTGLKSVVNALDIRSRLLQNLERAAVTCISTDKKQLASVAIVGGGPAGIEMAGALAEFRKYVLPKDYPELKDSGMKITLLEGSGSLLSAMPENLSAKTLKYLRKMQVNVRMNTLVKSYDGKNIEFSTGEIFGAATFIWTAGIKAISINGIPESETGKLERIIVNDYNRVLSFDNVFAIGDVAQMKAKNYPDGHPMIAQPAIQQGKNVALNILRQLNSKPLKPFRYYDKGLLATIGKKRAVAHIYGFTFGGFFAWIIWSVVHLMSIIGVRNKLVIAINWMSSYFTYDKGDRVIIRPYYK